MANELVGGRGAGREWVIRDAATLASVSRLPAWQRLPSQLGSPAQSPHWLRACAESFEGPGLNVVGVGPVEAPWAVAPLERHGGMPEWLELLGVTQTYEPGDFLFESGEALEALLAKLVEAGTPLLLRRLPAEGEATRALQRVFRKRAMLRLTPAGSCPTIELDESWLEPERHLSRHRRTDLRRSKRLAEQRGGLSFEVLSPGPDTLAEPWRAVLEVENACWKARSGTSLKANAERGHFFERWARYAAEAGTLRIAILRIGGVPAAVQLAEERDGRYWTLKIGYDESFAACSPGNLMTWYVLAWAAAKGLRSFEFLGFAAEWTRRWTPLERACVAMRVYPVGARGLAAFGRDAVEVARRKLAARPA